MAWGEAFFCFCVPGSRGTEFIGVSMERHVMSRIGVDCFDAYTVTPGVLNRHLLVANLYSSHGYTLQLLKSAILASQTPLLPFQSFKSRHCPRNTKLNNTSAVQNVTITTTAEGREHILASRVISEQLKLRRYDLQQRLPAFM